MTRQVSQAVRHAQAGDPGALGFLYARYADNVHGYVRSIVRSADEAEAVTQQVFAELAGAIGEYQEREIPFLPWLLQAARGPAVERLRRGRAAPVAAISREPNAVGASR